MSLLALLKTAWFGLRTNLGRSLLTILGIVIGVSAIVLIISLGASAQGIILSELEGIGGEILAVEPGKRAEGATGGLTAALTVSLTKEDLKALRNKANVPGAEKIYPSVFVPESVVFDDEIFRSTIIGWEADALDTFYNLLPDEGEYFGDEEVATNAKVAVIGSRVREELFGTGEAVGEKIKIKNHSFRVVATLPKTGQVSLFFPDDLVVIPYSTAQDLLLGIDHFHEIQVIAASKEVVDRVASDLVATMRETHDIDDPEDDDFYVVTQEDILSVLGTVTNALTFFLSAIAGISLVVGGVGITNIMLVSITERTHEIGLRKALGATKGEVLQQFLVEALLLTLGGGIIGTGFAYILALIISKIVQVQYRIAWEVLISLNSVLLGVGLAVVVGVIFGIYPALAASKKSPIEALRYE